jgi:molybdenum cofactor guanylyltransferase
MLARAIARFTGPCAAVLVSARPATPSWALAESLGALAIADAAEDAPGPLAGIKAGLAWAAQHEGDVLAVAPCDAPYLSTDMYSDLRTEMGGALVAYATTPVREHPLCSVWRVAALGPLQAALAGGAHPPVRAFLAGLGARAVRFTDESAFANINRTADLAAPPA